MLIATGSLKGHSRRLAVLACYIPPGYHKTRGEAAVAHINDVIVHLKRRFTDPYLVIAGDYNQWDIVESLSDFPDLREAPVGPTRGALSIDKIFSNISRSITEAGTLEPLETEESDRQSDHRICLLYTSPSPRDRQKSRMPSSA